MMSDFKMLYFQSRLFSWGPVGHGVGYELAILWGGSRRRR